MGAVAGQPEAQIEHAAFARPQVLHQKVQRFLAFGILPHGRTLVVRHGLGELEVAVIVEDGIQRDRSARGRLQMGQMLETAAGAGSQFLRAGKMFAAMSQSFGLLLQQAQLLKMVRRQADQVALASHRDLQRLPNPPGGVGGQPRAVADVETIDGLHQPADRFLEQVGIAEGVVPEALGNVSGKANVGRGEAVLQVDVTIVQATDGGDGTRFVAAVLPDKLGHRPGFQRRTVLPQAGKVPNQHADQFALALPEAA